MILISTELKEILRDSIITTMFHDSSKELSYLIANIVLDNMRATASQGNPRMTYRGEIYSLYDKAKSWENSPELHPTLINRMDDFLCLFDQIKLYKSAIGNYVTKTMNYCDTYGQLNQLLDPEVTQHISVFTRKFMKEDTTMLPASEVKEFLEDNKTNIEYINKYKLIKLLMGI